MVRDRAKLMSKLIIFKNKICITALQCADKEPALKKLNLFRLVPKAGPSFSAYFLLKNKTFLSAH